MPATSLGPHANPVWSTFIFVTCMLLFLFYLESMINPMDLLASKGFVRKEYHLRPLGFSPGNHSAFVTYDEVYHGMFNLLDPGSTLVSIEISQKAEKAFGAHLALDFDPELRMVCNCSSDSPDENDLPQKSCTCSRLRSRYEWFINSLTVGWPCGVQAGWTDLTLACLDSELYRREGRHVTRRYLAIL